MWGAEDGRVQLLWSEASCALGRFAGAARVEGVLSMCCVVVG